MNIERPYRGAETGELLQELAARGVVRIADANLRCDEIVERRLPPGERARYDAYVARRMVDDLARYLESEKVIVHGPGAGIDIRRASIAVVKPEWLPMCQITVKALPIYDPLLDALPAREERRELAAIEAASNPDYNQDMY